MKSFFKRSTKALAPRLLGVAGALYVMLLRLTCPLTVYGTPWNGNASVIFALWHGRLLGFPFLLPLPPIQKLLPVGIDKRSVHALISSHTDGQIIATVGKLNGVGTVAGSSSKGGAAAFRQMLRLLKNNQTILITPDGPKGPRHQLKLGVLELSKLSGAPVVPVAFSAKRGKTFGSWDQFFLPYPFSPVVVLWGEPVILPAGADASVLAAYAEDVQTLLTALQDKADQLAQRTKPL